MTHVLHILTQPEDDFSRRILRWQDGSLECEVTRVDLTLPNPDYHALLDRLFEADSIQIW